MDIRDLSKWLFGSVFLCLIFSFGSAQVFAQDLEFVYFFRDVNSSTYKVSYEVVNSGNIVSGDVFRLEVYAEGKLVDNSCVMRISFEPEDIFKRHICNVKKDFQKYFFVASVYRGSELVLRSEDLVVLENYGKKLGFANVNFFPRENSTLVVLNFNAKASVSGSDSESELKLVHFIPKSVIPELTIENSKDYIESSIAFEILDSDPLIAWSVEEYDTQVNYSLKKELNSSQMQEFDVYVEEETSFQVLKFIVFGLVVLLFVFIGYNLVLKKKK